MLDGKFRRRRLPHWDVEDGIYFVTSCLEGSIPAQGLLDLKRFRTELSARPKPENVDDEEWDLRCQKMIFARFDNWIDTRPAAKWLELAELATIVRNAIYHFAGIRYDLLAYVFMPSHFHWVFHPRREWIETTPTDFAEKTPRQVVMKVLKGFTSRRCNQVLGTSGAFWQDESWDHVVRDEDELARIIRYIEDNPVKAGLVKNAEDWLWSSPRDRILRSIEPGQYLLT